MDSSLVGDVYLDQERIPLRSLNRSSADDLVARFGSPEKGQTNLDMLKAITQKSFRGGMFQKYFDDDEMVDYIRGGQYNKLDKKLYFSPLMGRSDVSVAAPSKNSVSTSMDANCATAKCFFNGYLYIAYRNYPSGAITNRLDKIDLATNTRTAITLPSAIANSTCPVTTMVAHRDKIFIGGKSIDTGSNFAVHRYDGVTTFSALAAGTGRKLVSFRDKLYVQGVSDFALITNEMSGTAALTVIKAGVGVAYSGMETVHDVQVFNGAVYILKADGLFRFDGVDVTVVFDFQNNVSLQNFRLSSVFNGRMYWVIKNTIYEFDGVNLTPLQDFSDGYEIISLESGSDRLWIGTRYSKSTKSIFPSENFPDPVEVENYTYAAVTFDGVGFFEFAAELHIPQNAGDGQLPLSFPVIPTLVNGFSRAVWIFPLTWQNESSEPRSSGYYFYNVDLQNEFDLSLVGDDRKLEVFSSSIDAGYPSVPKVLNGVMVDADGFDAENVTLELFVKTNYQGTISDWELAWSSAHNIADGVSEDFLLHDESDIAEPELQLKPPKFNSIEYYILAKVKDGYTVTEIPRISSVTLRHTLQPKPKRQWQLTIPVVGVDHSGFETLPGETRESTAIRRKILKAKQDGLPVLFYDIDYSKVKDKDDQITIAGIDWLEDQDVIAIKKAEGNWINRRLSSLTYDDINHQTIADLDDVGLRHNIGGSTDSKWSFSVDNEVRKSYAVYVRDIQSENIVAGINEANEHEGHSDYSSLMVITLQEV